jgi:hypothetical protein
LSKAAQQQTEFARRQSVKAQFSTATAERKQRHGTSCKALGRAVQTTGSCQMYSISLLTSTAGSKAAFICRTCSALSR